MATAEDTTDDSDLKNKGSQELKVMLTEEGLNSDYWVLKFQEQLGVTSAKALQHLKEEDLEKLKSQVQYSWEERALEHLLERSWSTVKELQMASVKMMKKKQKEAEQTLQELRELEVGGRSRQEEAVKRKEAELRKAMEIPEEYWPEPEIPLKEVTENMQKHLNLMEKTLLDRQTLSDRELVRQASGGLALQGIYKTADQEDLKESREELIAVPKEFVLRGPEHGIRMETKEFTSSQEESLFTENIKKLGFAVTILAKIRAWVFGVEGGIGQSKHLESMETHQSHSEHSYFCYSKFSYIPLAACHFPLDQLQLSKAALQELKGMEDILEQVDGPDKKNLLKNKTKNFFQRFGSHANKGPVHLGGIYCWKAIAEGFKRQQLDDVRQRTIQALDNYIRVSYNGLGIKGSPSMSISHPHSEEDSHRKISKTCQIKLSVDVTGGPPEAQGIAQWRIGLVANNQTWSVIDRGLQLEPIWRIILYSRSNHFRNPHQVADCLKENYAALTGLTDHIQDEEEIPSVEQEAEAFLEDVKTWNISDPEEKIKKLKDVMETLKQKSNSHDMWIKCLSDRALQNFLTNIFDWYKKSSTDETQFITSNLKSLLSPYVYKATNFSQSLDIKEWIYQSESKKKQGKTALFGIVDL